MIPGDARVEDARGSGGGLLLVRLASVGSLVFLAGAMLPAAMEAAALDGADSLRGAYHSLCHQLPSRSLSVAGHPVAICSRCLGLYLGGALALTLAALAASPARTRTGAARRAKSSRLWKAGPGRLWLAVAVAPTAIDALVNLVFGAGLPNASRLVISLPAGFVAGIALAAGLHDLGGCRWTNGLPICSDPR